MELEQISVLIVEDNASAARLLQNLLEDLGVRRVSTVNDGQAALDHFTGDGSDVDIVLCDWRMPNMGGPELLQRVRAIHPEIPFMMISANADEDSLRAARSQGVNAYLTKPYAPGELEKKLKYLVLQM